MDNRAGKKNNWKWICKICLFVPVLLPIQNPVIQYDDDFELTGVVITKNKKY